MHVFGACAPRRGRAWQAPAMSRDDLVPPAARHALDVWLRHHDELAPGLVEGLYLVGSIAFGNWQPDSDIDIIVFTRTPPATAETEALRAAHAATLAEIGSVDIDGPRLAWNDVAEPPSPIVRPWTLHGEFHHDDGCFELNPATWLALARHGVAVRGPAVSELTIAVDQASVLSFVEANTEDYWRSVAGSIERALEDPDRHEFESDLTSWSVLGVARMLYTARTGDLTSKSDAGRWIVVELPEYSALVEHSLVIRESSDAPPDDRTTASNTVAFMNKVADLVAAESR